MQVHNELSKSDYFQKLNINDNISDISIWRPMTMDVEPLKTLATTWGEALRECRCIGNTLDSTTTTHRAKSSPGELVVYII